MLMMTFKEFQKECEYLPFEQQKECYEWYVKGCLDGWNDRIENIAGDSTDYVIRSRLRLVEMDNAETEEN